MANTIATPSFATPSQWTTDTKVAIASDGTAFVLWCDGTNIKYSIASAPYTSWTTSTLTSAVGGATRWAGAVAWDSATDNLLVACTDSGNTANLIATPFTKSGASWTKGTSHTVATGVVPYQGCATQLLKDGQGRYWCALQPGTANTYVYVYLSTDGGVTWSQSLQSNENLSGAIIPAMAIVGGYLTLVWGNGNISWQRLDVSGVSLGAWSAVFTDSTNFVDNVTNSNAFFPFASGAKGMFAWVYNGGGGAGTFVSIYDPVANTFSAKTTLQTGTNQGQCTLLPSGADIFALYTLYSAANSYALVYKKYTNASSTWDTSATTVEAAGANIQWPSGVVSGSSAYFLYTTGTASPYTLNFDSHTTSTLTTTTRTVAATAALAQSRALPLTGALKATDIARSASATAALAVVRPVAPTSAALLATGSHLVSVTGALQASNLTRTVAGSASLTLTTFSQRSVAPVSVALQLLGITRSVTPSSASLTVTLSRSSTPSSAALLATLTRTIPVLDTALSASNLTRTVASVTVSLIGPSIIRSVAATLSAGGPPTRSVASSVALQALGLTRTVGATTAALQALGLTRTSSATAPLSAILTHGVAASASLIDPTTVTPLYGTDLGGTSFTQADQLVATGGGSSTAYTPGGETFNFTGWMELTPQGGVLNVLGALGTPDGHGWVLDNKNYENSVIQASANWYAWLTLHCDAAQSGTITFRAYRMHWDAPSATATFPQQIFAYTTPPLNLVAGDNLINVPMQSAASVTFAGGTGASGDKIYVDIWYHQTGGGTATSTTAVKVASGSAGIPFLFELDIPAIVTTTSTRTVATSVALTTLNLTRSAALSAALSGPIVRQTTTSVALAQANIARSLATTADLALAVNTVPYYGSNTADRFVGVGDQLLATGGGAATTYTPGNQTFNFTGWMQLLAQGGVTGVHGAIGAPDGHGWWLDWAVGGTSPLNGQTIPAGNWSGTFTLKCDAAQTGTLTFRIYKGNWAAGTASETFPTNIITYTTGTLNLVAGDNTVTLPATAGAATSFGATDSLYLDIWYNQTGGGTAASLTALKVASGASGVAGVFEIDAPTNLQTHTHQIAASAALILSPTHAVTARAALLTTATRSIALTLSMSGIAQQRTVAATLTANGTFSRTVITNAALAKQRSVAATVAIAGVPPMPVISYHVPAYASDITYAPSNANDTNYASIWRSATHIPSVASPAWVVYDLSSQAPTKVLVNLINEIGGQYYNTDATNASSLFTDYTIDVNAAPGGAGSAPTSGWVTLVTVSGNFYPGRTHYLDMTGYNWIRLQVTASSGTAPNNDVLVQMDIHDASRGQRDTWLFVGDSITAEGMGHHNITGAEWGYGSSLNSKVLAMTGGHYNPATIDGGCFGMTMSWAATNILGLTANFTGGYVEISFGTNDCNQNFPFTAGDSHVQAIYNNLLTVIDNFLALPQSPTVVVPYIPWGSNNGGNLGINANLVNQYVDAHLPTDRPSVLRGPDMWSFFNAHQTLIRDGIHPTFDEPADGSPSGYEWWQKLWTNWMATNVYGTPVHSIPFSVALATTATRQIGPTVALQTQRTVATSVALQSTTFVRTVAPVTTALAGLGSTRPVAASGALQALGLRRQVATTVATVLAFTHPLATSVALQGSVTRQITSHTVAFFGTPTRALAVTGAILGFTEATRPVGATAALLLPDNLRTVAGNSGALLVSATRQVGGAVSLFGGSARALPASVALKTLDIPRYVSVTIATLLTQTRAVGATTGAVTGALQATSTRRASSLSVSFNLTLARGVAPLSAAFLLRVQREVIPNTALALLGATRAVGATASLTSSGTRTSAALAALSATLSRTVPESVAFSGTVATNRSVSASAALARAGLQRTVALALALGQFDQLRTVTPLRAVLQSTFIHALGASVVLNLTLARQVTPTSATLLATLTRQVIPNVPLVAAALVRTVSTTLALTTLNRTHAAPMTLAVAGFTERRLGAEVALVTTFTHATATSVALSLLGLVRSVGVNSVALAPPPRLVGASTALRTTATHPVSTTAALGADIADNMLTVLMPGVAYYQTVANVFGY